MKFLVLLIALPVFAETYTLEKGSAEYEVNFLFKRVTGESREVKGKIECGEKVCEFLAAVPVKSFTSSDANRDDHMIQAIEASSFPIASGKGKFEKSEYLKPSFALPVEVEFHGVKKTYAVQIAKASEERLKGDFVLLLESHGVKRPKLFGKPIENEVPLHFDLVWKKSL